MSMGARALAFTFEFDGEVLYRRRIDGVMDRLEDMRPAFEQIGTEFRAHMYETFATEGVAGGAKWPELNKRYAAWKAKHYPGQGILAAETKLARAMSFRGLGNITQISAREAVFGGSRRTPDGKWDLGLTHHFGSTKRKIPARPIIRLTPKVKSRFTRILREFLNQEA